MSEVLKIRGLKTGLQLLIDKNATFDEVKKLVLEKLQSGDKFFIRGTTVFIDKNTFQESQIEELRRIFHRHGMLFSDKMPPIQPKPKPKPVTAPATVATPTPAVNVPPPVQKVEKAPKTLRIHRTLHGGEEIRTEASVVIEGNVNPGAQVIAGGSIEVRGKCRGIVHAGAFGDRNAYISADYLDPIQIRIDDLVGRPPDNTKKKKSVSITSRITNFIGSSGGNKKSKKNEDQEEFKPARAFIEDGKLVFRSMAISD